MSKLIDELVLEAQDDNFVSPETFSEPRKAPKTKNSLIGFDYSVDDYTVGRHRSLRNVRVTESDGYIDRNTQIERLAQAGQSLIAWRRSHFPDGQVRQVTTYDGDLTIDSLQRADTVDVLQASLDLKNKQELRRKDMAKTAQGSEEEKKPQESPPQEHPSSPPPDSKSESPKK